MPEGNSRNEEIQKISERSPNDTTFSSSRTNTRVLHVRIRNLRNIERIKFFLLRDSIEFPVTVHNNIVRKFDVTKIRYDKFNFKVRRRIHVVKWFSCSYSSGYSVSGSFETIAGFGKNRRDGMGKSKKGRREGGAGETRALSSTRSGRSRPRHPSSHHRRALTEMSGRVRNTIKPWEATYKFLHRANYGIRKEGRIRSVTFHPRYSHSHTMHTHIYVYGRTDVYMQRTQGNLRVVSVHI